MIKLFIIEGIMKHIIFIRGMVSKNEINKKIGKKFKNNIKDFYSTCPSAVILMFNNSKK